MMFHTRSFRTITALFLLLSASASAKLVHVTFRQALAKGYIAVEGQGAGGYTGACLNLCVANKTTDDLDIYIEPATAFKPADKNRQPLWTVGDEHLFVSAEGHREVKLNAFCGNSHAAAPQQGTRYSFWQTSNPRIVSLMRQIRKYALYDYLGQRAVWTLTNDHNVNTIFDGSRAPVSRALANFTAALKGVPPPEFFYRSSISSRPDDSLVFMADYSRAIVDLHWTKESHRNMHVRIYREDGSLYREVTSGFVSSADGHSLTISFDARKLPKGRYTVSVKDDDNYLWASKTVTLGEG